MDAKCELWTRFLPPAIAEWRYGAGVSETVSFTPPDESCLTSLISSWLEETKSTIQKSLPAKLSLVARGADLNQLKVALEASIAPPPRDALLGEWLGITNRVFGQQLDLRKVYFFYFCKTYDSWLMSHNYLV